PDRAAARLPGPVAAAAARRPFQWTLLLDTGSQRAYLVRPFRGRRRAPLRPGNRPESSQRNGVDSRMSEYLLEVRDLHARVEEGEESILNGVNLVVRPGEL